MAAITRFSMNADGIAYLDLGDAFIRGGWSLAINPVWSPLYPWILGLVLALFQPSMLWEFPLVHLVNFAIFLFAIFSFEFFWRQLGCFRNQVEQNGGVSLPDWIWVSLGYSLFIFVTLNLISIWAVTPDMLMGAFVLIAAGLLVRIRLEGVRWSSYLLLGFILGLGYLAKTIMFPLSFLFLILALMTPDKTRRAWLPFTGASVVFLLISLPYIALISSVQGRLTIGEAGRLTYLRYVNGISYPHWQGETAGLGEPAHASRKIFDDPAIYEFGAPVGGTYPISYNPAYWYEGATAQFNLIQQARAINRNGLFYLDLFLRQQGGILLGALFLVVLSFRKLPSLPILIRRFGLSWLALAVFAIYSLVYVEGRYVGIFLLLLWGDLLANVRLPDVTLTPKIMKIAGLGMASFVLAHVIIFNLEGYGRFTQASSDNAAVQQMTAPEWPGEVAETLWQLGAQPGDKVGVIGYGFDSFWARLAKVQIVAEMFEWQADPFWLGDPAFKEEVLQAFAGTGAKAIVAEHVPYYAQEPGWHRVGNSNYFIYLMVGGD